MNKVLLQPTQAPSSCSIYDCVRAPTAKLSEHNGDRTAQDVSVFVFVFLKFADSRYYLSPLQ